MKKYGNDYRQSGKEFEYTGKWYGTKLSEKELGKYGLYYTVLMTGALLLYIASLMLNHAGNRIFWIQPSSNGTISPTCFNIDG